jgi:hypothetical protein
MIVVDEIATDQPRDLELRFHPEAQPEAAGANVWTATGKQSVLRLAGLRPAALPVLEALPVYGERRRMLLGIVGADLLDEPAIAGAPRVRDHHPVERALLGAGARQPQLHHGFSPRGPFDVE